MVSTDTAEAAEAAEALRRILLREPYVKTAEVLQQKI